MDGLVRISKNDPETTLLIWLVVCFFRVKAGLKPEILLFDEVTAALDPEMVREVLDVILRLADQGKTMLIVTHEMQFARAVADRVIFLEDGVIKEEGKPEQFFDAPQTERAKEFLKTFTFERKHKE